MSEPGSSRRGRAHDAEGAREAILNAAEEVFAEHGYDGARVDAIAAKAGYNKSLLFQYFGDKLGLYTEIIKRADKEMSGLQGSLLAPLLEDETIATDAGKFRTLLETIVTGLFDYLVAHPRLVRILNWEAAEGWQMFAKFASQFDTEDAEVFEKLFNRAWRAGLLRLNTNAVTQLTMILQLCFGHLTYIPLYGMLYPGEDFSSPASLAQARAHIVDFVVSGMMTDQ